MNEERSSSGRSDETIDLQSEFASVRISLDRSGAKPRLRVEDRLRDRVRFIEPEELSLLPRLKTGNLDEMLPY